VAAIVRPAAATLRSSAAQHGSHVCVPSAVAARSTLSCHALRRSACGSVMPPSLQLRGFSSAAGANVEGLPDAMQRMLSLDNASQMEKNRHAMRQTVAQYQRHPSDTGSSEVQIAILSERIKYMTNHVQLHRKDRHNNRGLVQMVQDRRKLLKYLKRDSLERYNILIEQLGIRDAINLMPQRVFLPAKAAEAAVQRERQKLQLVEQGRKQVEAAAVIRDSFAGKREEKAAKLVAKDAASAAAAAAANADSA